MGDDALATRDASADDADRSASPRLYAKSMEDLLTARAHNPAPTTVPPPIAALAGNIGERHVLVFVGLPLRGKRTIALRLTRYLRFFHGARCRAFDVAYAGHRGDAATSSLVNNLRDFLRSGDAITDVCTEYGIEAKEASAKHVDSGRVAVVYSSDASATFYETWSGTSKERRRAILKELEDLERDLDSTGPRRMKVKTIFIETTLTREELVEEVLAQRVARDARNGRVREDEIEAAKESWRRRLDEYRKLYVTLQEDGSEDDLSYIKLYNYGERVQTNKMRAYLPQRIVQFLTATHPTAHKIYLCRHGESEYNVTGRLGGNSGITAKGVAFSEILSRFRAGTNLRHGASRRRRRRRRRAVVRDPAHGSSASVDVIASAHDRDGGEHRAPDGAQRRVGANVPARLSQHRRNLRRRLRGHDARRDRGEEPAGRALALDG